jgi:hypothetical protein
LEGSIVKVSRNRQISPSEGFGRAPRSTRARRGALAATALSAAVTVFGAAVPAPASADPRDVDGDYSINGTFTATSDGQWAKTRDVFKDEATVVSTWTITSTCSTPYRCTGQVKSDQGWTADMHSLSGLWYVSRDIDNWMPCPDGTGGRGHQIFMFYLEDDNTLAGQDKTIGNSGNCGKNLPLVIKMPFLLTKKD